MQVKNTPAGTWVVAAGGVAVCILLVGLGLARPDLLTAPGLPSAFPFLGTTSEAVQVHPFIELLKLVVSAGIGAVITSVHKRYRPEKQLSRTLEQSLILLCVSGALMMIIIGNSIPRALGIAGGAGIIRFRTPIKDAKDATLFFMLLGLGMACGLGAFAVAGLGTIFLTVLLMLMDRMGSPKTRAMELHLVADGPMLPAAHLRQIFAEYRAVAEAQQLSQGEQGLARYDVVLPWNTPLEEMSEKLMNGSSPRIRSLAWETARKKKGKKEEA